MSEQVKKSICECCEEKEATLSVLLQIVLSVIVAFVMIVMMWNIFARVTRYIVMVVKGRYIFSDIAPTSCRVERTFVNAALRNTIVRNATSQ